MKKYKTVGTRKTYEDLAHSQRRVILPKDPLHPQRLPEVKVNLGRMKYNPLENTLQFVGIRDFRSHYWEKVNRKKNDFVLWNGNFDFLNLQFDENGQLIGMINHFGPVVHELLEYCGDWIEDDGSLVGKHLPEPSKVS